MRAAHAVSIRVYGPLNDFLPRARRGVRVSYELRDRPSLKDAIEALGVPHVEVDLVLVNGAAQPFDYRLRDGDDVSAFPRFRVLAVGEDARVGTDPPRPVRFAADGHLGKLASLLRLAGFDTIVRDDDAVLAGEGARDERVVVTRDVGLLKRSVLRLGYWVRHTDPDLQFAELLERFDLASDVQPFTRCLVCNAELEPAAADAVADQLQPCTRAEFREFMRCPGCDRVYWQGTHHRALCQTLDRALARAIGSG